MSTLKVMLIAVGLMLCSASLWADEIHIADGDTHGLMVALSSLVPDSGLAQPRVITLAANGRYLFTEDTAGATVHGDVRLQANGAVWTGNTVNHRISIKQSGTLRISSLNVRDLRLVLDGTASFRAGFGRFLIPAAEGAPWIQNDGNLKIRDSSFAHITIENKQFGLVAGLIGNRGAITLENVTVHQLHYKATSELAISTSLFLTSDLDAHLRNLTITGSKGKAPAIVDVSDCNSRFSCSFTLANSIVVHNSLPLCRGEITSFGNNILDDSSCGPLHASDRILADFDLLPFNTKLGSMGVLPLPANSPAIDAGGQGRCPQQDANGTSRSSDGDGDGIGACDIGAWEFPAPLQAPPGILNGLFFQSVADGHYVQLEETAPGRYVVFWSTFDQNGKPVWILATGTRTGTTIHAEAYISLGGRLQKGGAPTGQEVEPWGEIEVETNSCSEGTFRYQSTFPEFGSGEFKLDRLAFVHELGCQ